MSPSMLQLSMNYLAWPTNGNSKSSIVGIMSSNLFDVYQHVVPGQHVREYPGATCNGTSELLELSVKQYVPKEQMALQSTKTITILAAGGNGFPKVQLPNLRSDIRCQ